MNDKSQRPDSKSLAEWLGTENYKSWKNIVHFIELNYPGVFIPEWLFGGHKYGWYLRFKKSKSFCSLIPEYKRFIIQIVFGAEERRKAELMLPDLVSHARQDYKEAPTYHDGKWLALVVDSKDVLKDTEKFLVLKRKPKQVCQFVL